MTERTNAMNALIEDIPRRKARRPRRGVALLLVLISLGAAGALTSFYLISQENSAAIGTNAEAASSSDWAARTGAKLGLAVLETEADWRSVASSDGLIIDGATIGDADVSVTVTNIDGEPPSDDDTDLVVTAIAVVDGLTSMRQMVVNVKPAANVEESLDEELGEFGIYARDGIEVSDDSLITAWHKSPGGPFNKSANLGAGFALESAFDVDETSAIQRAALYVMNSANSGLKDMVRDPMFDGGAGAGADCAARSGSRDAGGYRSQCGCFHASECRRMAGPAPARRRRSRAQ